MRIRDIPLEDRPDIGRKLYEARLTPMTWREAVRLVIGDPHLDEVTCSALAQSLARDHALRSGLAWPPVTDHWMTFPGAAERDAERRAARRASKGSQYRQRREALGMTTAQIAALFPGCPVDEIERIEREGPDDADDHRLMMRALDDLEYEASLPKRRNWLILGSGPARFTDRLPASA